MGLAELRHIAAMSTAVGIFLFAFLPFIVNLGVLAIGIVLWQSDLDDDEVLRLAGWMVVGMAMLGLMATWTITHQNVRGRRFAHSVFVTANNLSVGALIGLVLGWYDVGVRRYKQEAEARRTELQRQINRLDEFASMVSHDLRNPLSVAVGNLELARTDGGSERLETVAASLDRMNQIIDDVLTLAREGHAVEDTERVVLSDISATCWANVQTETAEIRVVDDLAFDADVRRIRLILENLFRNAVEHAGPSVTVRVGSHDGGFFVEDDGPGIPADIREAVFEPGHSSSAGGTGFGLSIVSQMVAAHGWEIDLVEGTAGGARFEITGVKTRD